MQSSVDRYEGSKVGRYAGRGGVIFMFYFLYVSEHSEYFCVYSFFWWGKINHFHGWGIRLRYWHPSSCAKHLFELQLFNKPRTM